MKRCIVIGAGDIALTEIEKKEEDCVIAVDGGFLYCKLLHLEPDYIIGDFDSVENTESKEIDGIQSKYPQKVVKLPCEKDDTDMLAALRLGLEKGYREFLLYGSMGGRLEHTVANLQCLIFLKHNGAKGYMIDEDCMIIVIENESIEFPKELEGLVSVFTLGQTAEGVGIEGMKYPLEGAVLTNDYPIGISNELIGKESKISVKNGTLAIIVRWQTQ